MSLRAGGYGSRSPSGQSSCPKLPENLVLGVDSPRANGCQFVHYLAVGPVATGPAPYQAPEGGQMMARVELSAIDSEDSTPLGIDWSEVRCNFPAPLLVPCAPSQSDYVSPLVQGPCTCTADALLLALPNGEECVPQPLQLGV